MLVYAKDGNLQNGFQSIFGYLDSILTEHFGPPMNPMKNEPSEIRP
jgi:hypothetical protein